MASHAHHPLPAAPRDSLIPLVVIALTSVVLSGSAFATPAELVHSYDLTQGLDDDFGGNALVANGGVVVPGTGYVFTSNQEGLLMEGAIADADDYSIELVYELDTVAETKVIDFLQLTATQGLYHRPDAKLMLWPHAAGAPGEAPYATPLHVVFTRANQEEIVYVNGALHVGPLPIQDGRTNGPIWFFQHDIAGALQSGGTATRVRIYDGVVTGEQALLLSQGCDDIADDDADGVANCLEPPVEGLISWYRAENDATDAIGGRHGTLVGDVAFEPGKVGNAFSLGTGVYVHAGFHEAWKLQDGAFAAYFKTSTDTGTLQAIVDTFSYLPAGAKGVIAGLNADKMRGQVNPFEHALGSESVSDGTWHHMVVTWTTGVVDVYLDGALTDSQAFVGDAEYPTLGAPGVNPDDFTNTDLTIGAETYDNNGPFTGYYFNGLIDEVQIYDRYLSGAEVMLVAGETDGCPDDPDKTDPGLCGCGVDDATYPGSVCDTGNPGPCAAGVGACAAGVASCDQTYAAAVSDETCDNVDDDCNGLVDDGWVPQPTSCGVGACASTGVTVCSPTFTSAEIVPQTNVPPGETFTHIAAAGAVVLALRTDGTAAGWGRNDYGQANPPGGTFVALATSQYHSLGLRPDGSVEGWGYSPQGQTVTQVGPFKSIACGEYWSVGLRDDGSIQMWGGHNRPADFQAGNDYIAVDAGSAYALAQKSDGSLVVVNHSGPAEILNVPAGDDFVAISAGFYHALALRADGSAVGWGLDDHGEASPPPGPFIAIEAGNHRSWGLRPDGTLIAWGNGGIGPIYGDEAPFKLISGAEIAVQGDLDTCEPGTPAASDETCDGVDDDCNGLVDDHDHDGDGTASCVDSCPDDPDVQSGPCTVCGNGTLEPSEQCDDGNTESGDCCHSDCTFEAADTGCGDPSDDACRNPDSCDGAGVCLSNDETADSDGDQTRDCEDGCPDDPGKAAPGACGCGTPDTDGDGDGIADCEDVCPAVNPATCGPDFYLTVRTADGLAQIACTTAGGIVSCAQSGGVAIVTPITDQTTCE